MSLSDYILDIALIAIVVLQMRGRRLSASLLVLPIVIVGIVCAEYLHGIPTGANDLALVLGCAVVGSVLGILCAVFTSVTLDPDGRPFAKAGIVAAILWILGCGARFAFQLYATHGGGPAIVRFSAAHGITSQNAWAAAIILMAIGEVVFRSALLFWRGYRLTSRSPAGTFTVGAGGRRLGA